MRAGIDNVEGAESVDVVDAKVGSRDEVAEGIKSENEVGVGAGGVDEVEVGVNVVETVFVVVQPDTRRRSQPRQISSTGLR